MATREESEPSTCPSATDKEQIEQVQRPGGGGAPGTAETATLPPASVGEGVTEEQRKESERD
jgi:hypothetical protein